MNSYSRGAVGRMQDCREWRNGPDLDGVDRYHQNSAVPSRAAGSKVPVNLVPSEKVIVSLQGALWNRKPETKYAKTNPVCFSRHGNAALTLWVGRHRQHNR